MIDAMAGTAVPIRVCGRGPRLPGAGDVAAPPVGTDNCFRLGQLVTCHLVLLRTRQNRPAPPGRSNPPAVGGRRKSPRGEVWTRGGIAEACTPSDARARRAHVVCGSVRGDDPLGARIHLLLPAYAASYTPAGFRLTHQRGRLCIRVSEAVKKSVLTGMVE